MKLNWRDLPASAASVLRRRRPLPRPGTLAMFELCNQLNLRNASYEDYYKLHSTGLDWTSKSTDLKASRSNTDLTDSLSTTVTVSKTKTPPFTERSPLVSEGSQRQLQLSPISGIDRKPSKANDIDVKSSNGFTPTAAFRITSLELSMLRSVYMYALRDRRIDMEEMKIVLKEAYSYDDWPQEPLEAFRMQLYCFVSWIGSDREQKAQDKAAIKAKWEGPESENTILIKRREKAVKLENEAVRMFHKRPWIAVESTYCREWTSQELNERKRASIFSASGPIKRLRSGKEY